MSAPEANAGTSGEASVLTGLLQRCGQGDEAAMAELYDRTSSRIYGLILDRVDSQTCAGDILTGVYVHVWQQSARYDPTHCPPLLWIAGIAIRTTRP